MARRPQNRDAMAELGSKLSALRAKLPPDQQKWRTLTEAIVNTTGASISVEQVRRMHAALVDPTTCQPEHLWAMVEFYRVTTADLGRFTEVRLANLRELAQNWKKMRGGRDLPRSAA